VDLNPGSKRGFESRIQAWIWIQDPSVDLNPGSKCGFEPKTWRTLARCFTFFSKSYFCCSALPFVTLECTFELQCAQWSFAQSSSNLCAHTQLKCINGLPRVKHTVTQLYLYYQCNWIHLLHSHFYRHSRNFQCCLHSYCSHHTDVSPLHTHQYLHIEKVAMYMIRILENSQPIFMITTSK